MDFCTDLESYTAPNYISKIPIEIRELIFNLLPQEDAISSRDVCLQWREEIDQFYKFEIDLDSDITPGGMQELLKYRVRYFKVCCGSHIIPPMVFLKRGRPNFFAFPKCMRRLEMSSLQNITEMNYWALLQECGPYLTNLYIMYDECWINSMIFLEPAPINFRNLKKLHIIVTRSPCHKFVTNGAGDYQNETFFRTMKMLSTSSCKLKHLTIEIKVPKEMLAAETLDRMATCCRTLIGRQDTTLDYLKLRVGTGHKGTIIIHTNPFRVQCY